MTAVAGRDYMIMATDTRMMGTSGYDILERHHIHSRIWAPIYSTASTSAISSASSDINFISPDGSLNINLFDELQKLQQSQPVSSASSSLRLLRESTTHSHHRLSNSPILIGSVGCQADCEELKRMVRSELRTAIYFGEISVDDSVRPHNSFVTSASPSFVSMETMAVLLSQVLYSRRTFPFGCYCILGGMSPDVRGQVYVYDAIGSYEPLAIACTGTGFELLQPILDRQFNPLAPSSSSGSLGSSALQSGNIIRRPTSLQINCPTVEEAIQILINAYRSVSEREIGVGDHVVFYSIQRIQDDMSGDDTKKIDQNEDGNLPSPNMVYQSKIWTAPLKKN